MKLLLNFNIAVSQYSTLKYSTLKVCQNSTPKCAKIAHVLKWHMCNVLKLETLI